MEHFSQPNNDSTPVVRESSTYLTDSEAASVCTLFGDGLESGMSYARIIEMMERQGYEKKLINRLRHAMLEKGDMLGESFARYGLLDATARKLVYVAEQQGKLPRTFKSLAKFYGKRHKRRKKLVLSFVEPCILIMLGLIVARNLFTTDLDVLTQSTNIVDTLTPILIQSGIQCAIFGLIAYFIGMVYMNLPVDFGLRNAIHRAWIALPLGLLNEAARLHSIAVFCSYSEQSISSGLTVHRALALAAEASNNPKFESRIPVAQRAIEEGRTLAAALYEADALPSDVLEYVDIGEESGRLEERLAELGLRYEEKSNEAFENSMKAMVYIIRFVVIIVVIIAVLMSIMQLLGDNLQL